MNFKALSLHYFCSSYAIGAFTIYSVLYFQKLSFSPWQIALLMTTFTLMRMICPSFFGWLADRTGKKVYWIQRASLSTVCTFSILFFLTSFQSIILGVILIGFFWSAIGPLTEALTFAHVIEKPSRYSSIRVWGSVGFVSAVLVVGKILEYISIKNILWIVELGLMISFGATFFLKEAFIRAESPKSSPHSVYHIIKQPNVLGLLAAGFFMSASHGTVNTFLTIHLANHHYSTRIIGGMWAIGVIIEILFFFYSYIVHRFILRKVLLFCFMIAVVRFLLLGWGVNWLSLLIISQIFHGFTYGVHHIATIGAVNHYFHGSYQARGQTLYSGISVFGGLVLGQLMSGYTLDRWGGEWAFTLSSFLGLIGLCIVWFSIKDMDSHSFPKKSY